MLKNYKYLTLKKEIIKRNKFIKKGGKYTHKNTFLKKKIKLKEELESIISKNELKIEKELKSLNIIEKNKSNIENLNKEKKSFIEFPSIQLLNIYLFISKSIVCIFLLPFIKNNFNVKNSIQDMIKNMYNCIFTMNFFKKNFNSVIAVIDSLGNIFEPYKELKNLLTYKNKVKNRKLEYLINKCFYSFMSFETLMKIQLIMELYKNKDLLVRGNSFQKSRDIVYLISGVLTLLEIVLCSSTSTSIIKNYISPFQYITFYIPYIINAIEISSNIIHLYKNNNIEFKNLLEKKGFMNIILTFLCSSIQFYNEEKIEEKTKTKIIKSIKKLKSNKYNLINNNNNKNKITSVIGVGLGLLKLKITKAASQPSAVSQLSAASQPSAAYQPSASPLSSFSDDSLNLLRKKQTEYLQTALEELNTHNEKKSHWIWWVFPTEQKGNSEPEPKTNVTKKSFVELLENPTTQWVSIIDKFISITKKNDTQLSDIVPLIDHGRIKFFFQLFDSTKDKIKNQEIKDKLEFLKKNKGTI